MVSLQPERPASLRFEYLGITVHQTVHVLCFAILAFLASRVFEGWSSSKWAGPLCLLFGISIEVMQHWIYGQAIEWADVREDAIGIVVMLLITGWWRRPGTAGDLRYQTAAKEGGANIFPAARQ